MSGLILHHLGESRSQRILWLLEELELDYEIVYHERDPATRRSPASLAAVHPLAKAPVLQHGETLLCESGAIVEYLVKRCGDGRLAPTADSPTFAAYAQWLHFAEGSAIFPFLFQLLLGMVGGAGPLEGHLEAEIDKVLDFMEAALQKEGFFAGPDFTAADVMMTFVVEFADGRGLLGERPKLSDHLHRMRARPAFQRAVTRGATAAKG